VADIAAPNAAQHKLLSEGSGIGKALNCSVKRGEALTRHIDNGTRAHRQQHWVENRIRPWAIGRANWMVAGSRRAGPGSAAIVSLIRSAQLNGRDPHAYLKDILTRLATHRASDIAALPPHRWQPKLANP
jgi:hypothetical protein